MDQHPWEQARQDHKEQRRRERAERRAMRRESCGGPGNFGGMVFGLLVIAMGVLFLLNNLGIIYIAEYWDYWPVFLIGLGVSKMLGMRNARSAAWGLVFACVGSLLLLRNLGIIYGNVWQFIWPIFVIGAGLSMLASHLDWWDRPDQTPGNPAGPNAPHAKSSSADRVYVDVLFSGDERRVVSQNFEGGRTSALFGGIELDLRGAATKLPEVRIHADAVFGGVDIRIPESWIAEVRGTGVFGGYVDKTHHVPPTDGSAPARLIVKGGAVFGGVSVRN